jgi:hypothetical protein
MLAIIYGVGIITEAAYLPLFFLSPNPVSWLSQLLTGRGKPLLKLHQAKIIVLRAIALDGKRGTRATHFGTLFYVSALYQTLN